jgi:type VI secretion system protein ImpG
MRTDSDLARMLATLSTNNVLLGCTPVVNLFRQRGEPIRLTHATASYPVLADARRAFAYAVQAIESVKLVRQTPQGESVQEFRPFYSLRHGQTPEKNATTGWRGATRTSPRKARLRNADLHRRYRLRSGRGGNRHPEPRADLHNRDLPSLSYGMRGGDLFGRGSSVRASASCASRRRPTASRGARAHWRLISHLSLNHLSLTGGGWMPSARCSRCTTCRVHRRRSGRSAASSPCAQAATTWLPAIPSPAWARRRGDADGGRGSLCRQRHPRVRADRRALPGLYVHANSFTQLVIKSNKNGEELLRCLPRSGDLSLL